MYNDVPGVLNRGKYPSGCLDTSGEGDLKGSIAPNLKSVLKTQGYNHGYYQHCNSLFSFCCYITAYFISKMNLLV